jgi:hypothetical protein
MYLDVTRQVDNQLGAGFFADPAFMTQLDVTFAGLYFDAVDAAGDPSAVPPAWRPLVEQRGQPAIEPIQFALAGMNAHINHDLPLAVTATCTALGTSPAAGAHLADYQKVDRLLDAAEQFVRQSFESAPELAVDQHLRAVGNLVAAGRSTPPATPPGTTACCCGKYATSRPPGICCATAWPPRPRWQAACCSCPSDTSVDKPRRSASPRRLPWSAG